MSRRPRGAAVGVYLVSLVAAGAVGSWLVAPAQASPPPVGASDAVALCSDGVRDRLERLGSPAARVAQALAYHERTGFRVDGVLRTAQPGGADAATRFRCGIRFDGTVAYVALPPAG